MPANYDAIIIGTGQSGPALASRLNKEGQKTAIIERKLVGGTCVNVGCTPTKALVASARAAYHDAWRAVLPLAALGPPVTVLRDYHADNLMWLPKRSGHARVGLLDFQDALAGSPAYDLVSLLEDARREVSAALAGRMLARYLAAAPGLDAQAFRAATAVLGGQRNAKIIGIFTRLARRDAKPAYLAMIPHVWRLLEGDLAHPALAGVRAWMDENVPRALRRAPPP